MNDSESVWCLTLHVLHEMIHWRNTRFFSEQTKHWISFLCDEEILICPCVLEYATLAINLSLLQHSHLKLDTIDRKEQILWEKQTPLNLPDCATTISLNPPDRATTMGGPTTISRLIVGMNDRQICFANQYPQSIVRSRGSRAGPGPRAVSCTLWFL